MTVPQDPDKLPPQPAADTGPLDPVSRFDDPSLRYRYAETPGYGQPSYPAGLARGPRRLWLWSLSVAVVVIAIGIALAILSAR